MWSFIAGLGAKVLGAFGGKALDRALQSVDNYVTSDTKRDEIRADVVKSFLTAQMAMMNGPGWRWVMTLMALYAVPDALHFGAVRLYSIFWCADCIWPQTWTIAALPPPHDQYSGWLVMSFFGGATALQAMNKWSSKK